MTEQITPSGRWVQGPDGSWTLARDLVPEHTPSKRPEEYEPVLVDWFGPEAQGSPWVQIAGTASSGWVYEPSSPTVAGVYRFTADAGQTAVLEWQGTTPLPFGLDDTYRCRIRVKAPETFDGGISVGFIGYAFNGTTLVDEAGTAVPTLGHAAIRLIDGQSDAAINGYALFEGYISGRSLLTSDLNVPADGTSAPWNNALKLASGVYYWRPYIQVTGGTGPAQIDVDAVEVFRLDSNLVVPGSVQTDLIVAGSGDIGTLSVDSLTLDPGAEDPTGLVLVADSTGNVTFQKVTRTFFTPDGSTPPGAVLGDLVVDESRLQSEPMFVGAYGASTQYNLALGTTYTKIDQFGDLQINIPCDGVLEAEFYCWVVWPDAPTVGAYSLGYLRHTVNTPGYTSLQITDPDYWYIVAWAALAGRATIARVRRVIRYDSVPDGGVDITLDVMAYGATSQAAAAYPRHWVKFHPYANGDLRVVMV